MNQEGDLSSEGFVIFRNVVNRSTISKIDKEIQKKQQHIAKQLNTLIESSLIKKKGIAIEKNNIKYLKNPNVWFPSINKILELNVLSLAQSIVGNELYIDNIELHQKSPGLSNTPPHQDNFYFGLNLKKNIAVTLYFALNDQNKISGGLGFYPGSHKHQFKHFKSNVTAFSSGIKKRDLLKFKIYNPKLYAGDLVIHHCNIVHAATKNNSNFLRSNIAIRLYPKNPKFDRKIQNEYKNFTKSIS